MKFKALFFIFLFVACGVSRSSAADVGQPQTINGYLVDVACALENAKTPDPNFPAKHDKGCLKMPDCQKSGYGVLTSDNKLYKFDANGNAEARKFIELTEKDKDWKVTVTGSGSRRQYCRELAHVAEIKPLFCYLTVFVLTALAV